MRARLTRLRWIPFFTVLLLQAGIFSAYATSSGKTLSTSAKACAVTGKFTGTKLFHGKLFWVFDRMRAPTGGSCPGLLDSFEVYIPSGSYSELARANVYPLSITEPAPGAEIDLHLESVKFKTGETLWLIAGDRDAYRVRN